VLRIGQSVVLAISQGATRKGSIRRHLSIQAHTGIRVALPASTLDHFT
jgi:hypothetical protein